MHSVSIFETLESFETEHYFFQPYVPSIHQVSDEMQSLRNSTIQSEEITFILHDSNADNHQSTMTSHNDQCT